MSEQVRNETNNINKEKAILISQLNDFNPQVPLHYVYLTYDTVSERSIFKNYYPIVIYN